MIGKWLRPREVKGIVDWLLCHNLPLLSIGQIRALNARSVKRSQWGRGDNSRRIEKIKRNSSHYLWVFSWYKGSQFENKWHKWEARDQKWWKRGPPKGSQALIRPLRRQSNNSMPLLLSPLVHPEKATIHWSLTLSAAVKHSLSVQRSMLLVSEFCKCDECSYAPKGPYVQSKSNKLCNNRSALRYIVSNLLSHKEL